MNINSVDLYHMTDEREATFFKGCLFVFDTSALLDFYLYPDKTKLDVFSNVFNPLNNKLWMTSHTEFEYLKNRLKTFKKPIKESYHPLKETNLSKVEDSIKTIKSQIDDLRNRTKKDDLHPYLDQGNVEIFINKIDLFSKDYFDFKKNIEDEIIYRTEEINNIEINDVLLKALEKYFKVGDKYSFKQIMNIVEEGKIRYEFKIPPGHEDFTKLKSTGPTEGDKLGTQIFGDLIIWKQIIDIAISQKKDIAFICNDLKIDWCYTTNKNTEKRIKSPREDLIREFNDETGKSFWMYNNQQFLHLAKKYLEVEIEEEQIEQVGQLTLFGLPVKANNSSGIHSGAILVYKCNNCKWHNEIDVNDLYLYFECVDSSERNMGTENHYEATASMVCGHCSEDIDGTFSIWEYPIGSVNYQEIELQGADVIHECKLQIELYGEDEDFIYPEDI